MLTADLIRVTKRNGELTLPTFDKRRRAVAEELAAAYLQIFDSHLGRSREELEESLEAVEVDPRDRLLAKGLQKLIEDRAELDTESTLSPEEVRAAVFTRAAAYRKALGPEDIFDRQTVLKEAAKELNVENPEDVEQALFADLRGAQILRSVEKITPAALVAAYDTGRAQAVLLRAVKVRVEVECTAPAAYRALFRRMKFLRLLYTLEKNDEDGYTLEIDGPMSLFGASTKYGLELASLLPVLEGCDSYALFADVKWQGSTETLLFRTEGGLLESDDDEGAAVAAPELSDEAAELLERLRALDSGWKIDVARDILELPGVGLCVPDLVFERDGKIVHLEVMGHWSRDAVWRRVELVEGGLAEPIVFAVSTRLRVSERALDEEAPGALYVYKGTMSAKGVLEKVEQVALRAAPPPPQKPRRSGTSARKRLSE